MEQAARNLCDAGEGFLAGKRYAARFPWSEIPTLAVQEGRTAAERSYATCCQEYRWCRRGMEITIEFAVGFGSTGRRFGVPFRARRECGLP